MPDRVWNTLISSGRTATQSPRNGLNSGISRRRLSWWKPLGAVAMVLLLLMLAACASIPSTSPSANSAVEPADDHASETLPELSPAALGADEPLRVVATTNIIADIVSQVGGESIELVELLPVGADPHSFVPAPGDLVSLNNAHLVIVNGLGLEESLESILDGLDSNVAVVSVNAGIDTLAGAQEMDDHEGEGHHEEGAEHEDEAEAHHDEDEAHDDEGEGEEHHDAGEEHHHHGAVDPHTWFSVHLVEQWVENIEHLLSDLDPANAEIYEVNAAAYLADLEALATELQDKVAELPVEQRKLVTDHDSFGYFADEYGFDVIGTVIPSSSTLASASAGELAALQNQMEELAVRAIFVGTTVNSDLADQIAADLGIEVVSLYTGSLSDAEGPASNYIDFMRYNTTQIVEGMK